MALRLTMAFSDNPRLQPLKDGTVKPQNIDLECLPPRSQRAVSAKPRLRRVRRLRDVHFRDAAARDVPMAASGLVCSAGVLESGTFLDQSVRQYRLGHQQPWGSQGQAHWCAGLRYDGGAMVSRHARGSLRHRSRDNVWYNGRTKALSHGGALGLDTARPVGHAPLAHS